MKPVLNPQTMLWIIGVLQPVSAQEIQSYLKISFEDGEAALGEDVIQKFCLRQERLKRLIRVQRGPDLFSLTAKGNDLFTKKHRHARDKERIYLLKEARKDRVHLSHGALATGLGGASPSVDKRTTIKGCVANKLVPVVPSGQVYWPRLSKKFIKETCRLQAPCDTSPLPLLSFENATQLMLASEQEEKQPELDVNSLGLMLGISPRLIVQIYRNPRRHYRTFTLKKKGGGERQIDSPRTFLKVIQQFLNDYFLNVLPVHDNVEAFRVGRSIQTNAAHHSGQAFVANIDIENFFGSVTRGAVSTLLNRCGYNDHAAALISVLCTKDEVLPQGASTSPALSNAYLYEFDKEFFSYCKSNGLSYSRYADDITISGSSKEDILKAISLAEKMLLEGFGLRLNKDKTRVASKHAQQRVTGLVVNEAVRPPRKLRREIRAMFHKLQAEKNDVTSERLNALRGYVSYLESFDTLRDAEEVTGYKKALSQFKRRKKQS